MNKLWGDFVGGRGAWGLLFLRLVCGVGLMVHGLPKVQQPFGWMDKPGAPSAIPDWMQAFAALSEFAGGFLLVLGMLTPVAALAVMGTMTGAKLIAHGGDPWISPGGRSWEMAGLYFIIATALLLVGPGRFSIDSLFFASKDRVSDERLDRVKSKSGLT